MESPRFSWSWKEGVRFALCWKFVRDSDLASLPLQNSFEALGSWIVQPLYKTLDYVSHQLRRPLTVVLFTLFTSLVLGIAFYNIPAFKLLGKIVPVQAIRFSLFVYIELIFFGLGCKAFGRFHNQLLVQLWKKGKLTPLFPGEKE